MKIFGTRLFDSSRIELGKGHITQFAIFENKHIGGIWIYNWETIEQNRFHTHAFNAYAFLISGHYQEQIIKDGRIKSNTVNQKWKPRFLPRDYCHRILKAAPNTKSIVFFGPWQKNWFEYFHDTKTWIKYTWGRKVVEKITGKNERHIRKLV